ncbi:hypothetical protein SUGI_0480390 [Cryptomeria japonica]|nr:hypothetical protein SUGI_0480390 [Cryptomeria japonica]
MEPVGVFGDNLQGCGGDCGRGGGMKSMIEPHRHVGVFIAKAKEEVVAYGVVMQAVSLNNEETTQEGSPPIQKKRSVGDLTEGKSELFPECVRQRNEYDSAVVFAWKEKKSARRAFLDDVYCMEKLIGEGIYEKNNPPDLISEEDRDEVIPETEGLVRGQLGLNTRTPIMISMSRCTLKHMTRAPIDEKIEVDTKSEGAMVTKRKKARAGKKRANGPKYSQGKARYWIPSGPLSILVLAKEHRINRVFPLAYLVPAWLNLLHISALGFTSYEINGVSKNLNVVVFEASMAVGMLHGSLYVDAVTLPYYTGVEASMSMSSGIFSSCICRKEPLVAGGSFFYRAWSSGSFVVFSGLVSRLAYGLWWNDGNAERFINFARWGLEFLAWGFTAWDVFKMGRNSPPLQHGLP